MSDGQRGSFGGEGKIRLALIVAGLLLAKFLRRSSEIGVRRALGAPRMAIYAQFLTEAGIIGLTVNQGTTLSE